jgi:hypothetical protein
MCASPARGLPGAELPDVIGMQTTV